MDSQTTRIMMSKAIVATVLLLMSLLVYSGQTDNIKVGTLHYNPPFEQLIDTSRVYIIKFPDGSKFIIPKI